MRYVNECVSKSKPYIPGKPLNIFLNEKNLTHCIKLDANENPFGSSPLVKSAIEKIDFNRYPDGGGSELKEYLANGYNLKSENFLITPGSNHIIELLTRAYLQKGHNAITAKNTFTLYKISTQRNGGEIIEIPLISGRFNLKGIKDAIDEKTDIIFICNPNNPTGVAIPREELINFIKEIDDRIIILIDEAYIDFAEDYLTLIDLIPERSNLIITRTFSKMYALAGLRIGYAISSKEIISDLSKLLMPFSVSNISLIAAKAALEDSAFTEMVYRHVFIERKRLETYFKSKDWFCYPSQTNFIYVEIPIDNIQQKLEERGILIRNLQSFGFDKKSFRITIGTTDENTTLINALNLLS